MAKYLVIFGVTSIDDDDNSELNTTVERMFDCDSDELHRKISDKKEYLQNRAERLPSAGGYTISVTVKQVLPL